MKDSLGSVIGTINSAAGSKLVSSSFDAWGRERNANGSAITDSSLFALMKTVTQRGFTGHEQVNSVGLIHMNGRMYDPTLGRFISADPIVQAPNDLQSYNRYAYVRNNPLTLTDPSGYSWLSKTWKKVKKNLGKVAAFIANPQMAFAAYTLDKGLKEFGRFARKNKYVSEVATVAGCFMGPLGCALASAGVTYGVTDGDLRESFTAGATAFVQAYLAGQIGSSPDLIGPSEVLAHGVLGGAMSYAQGGNFGRGFAAGAFGKAVNVGIRASGGYGRFHLGGDSFGKVVGRTSISAIAGGVGAKIAGGSFANGAVTASIQHLYNAEDMNDMSNWDITADFYGEIGLPASRIPGCSVVTACRAAVEDLSVSIENDGSVELEISSGRKTLSTSGNGASLEISTPSPAGAVMGVGSESAKAGAYIGPVETGVKVNVNAPKGFWEWINSPSTIQWGVYGG